MKRLLYFPQISKYTQVVVHLASIAKLSRSILDLDFLCGHITCSSLGCSLRKYNKTNALLFFEDTHAVPQPRVSRPAQGQSAADDFFSRQVLVSMVSNAPFVK